MKYLLLFCSIIFLYFNNNILITYANDNNNNVLPKTIDNDIKGAYTWFAFLDENDPELDMIDQENEGPMEYLGNNNIILNDQDLKYELLEDDARADHFIKYEPKVPIRLSNVSYEDFAEYFRRGEAVIVTDATKGWPMEGWTCETFAKKFPKAKMRQQYGDDTGKPDDMHDRQKIGDKKWTKQYDKVSYGNNNDVGPEFAPYYWGVKEKQNRNKIIVQKHTVLPYFLSEQVGNIGTMNNSAEIWFAVPKAGAKSHVDPHCEATMSVQLSGRKRWRLGIMPRVDHIATVPRFQDGDTDPLKWIPHYDFVLNPGEGVFFPPGLVHETRNVGDECAASVTYQWTSPAPVDLIRKYLPRMLLGEPLRGCEGYYGGWVTLSPNPRAYRTLKEARSNAKRIFKNVDKNHDGKITRDELKQKIDRMSSRSLLELTRGDEKSIRNPQFKHVYVEFLNDAFAYQDVDKNNEISLEEFVENYIQWNAVLLAKKRGRQVMKAYRKYRKRNKCKKKEDRDLAQILAVVKEDQVSHMAKNTHDLYKSGALTDEKIQQQLNKLPTACQKLHDVFRIVIRETRIYTSQQKTISHDKNQATHDEL